MKKLMLSAFGIVALSASVYGQSTTFDASNARDGETVEYCITHKKNAEIMANPAAMQSFAQDEIIRQKEMNNPQPAEKAAVWYVPIVFHVLHNGGVENISDEQILDALFVMNRDFRLQNADASNVHADFQGLPADTEIEFRLATKAPNGQCFTGITRTQNSLSYSGNGGGQVNAIKSGNDVYNGEWPGDEYLNVFICGDIGGAAGYTYTPSNWVGSGMDNGIWVLHNYVGSIGTSSTGTSRTLTHEAGHWLNLSHVWGPNNNPGNASSCSDDDGVTDTPNEIGVTSCNLNEMSCGPRANVENYMDYSYCSKMFTPGQATRMRNALSSNVANRDNLRTASNLAATGADGNVFLCDADFEADRTSVCAGEAVQFTDESYNAASGWTWTFTGGTPPTSSAQNPSVTYNTPGLYEVTLSATDGSLTMDETKTAYIRVLPAAAPVPIVEGFESYATLDNIEQWEVKNPDGNNQWTLITTAGLSSANSAKLQNYGQQAGSMDELVSAPVDLSGITGSMTLSFRYAYARRNTSDDDYFRVQVTNDCGSTWATRKTLHGFQLNTVVQSAQFTPSTEADWITVHMTNVTSQYWTNTFRYLFQFEAGGGNNMYLDNINIYQGAPSDDIVVGLGENEQLADLSVYPNPTENELNVRFSVSNAQDGIFEIQDISGKTAQTNLIHASAGTNVVFVDTAELASGVYFLRVNIAGVQETIQFVVK